MKQIDNQKVIEQADRYHELQRQRRDLRQQIIHLEDEMRKIHPALVKAGDGQDFAFPSADEYMKVCEISEVDGQEDVPKMKEMLLKLRRKIPMLTRTAVVVRYQTDDEAEENQPELSGDE